MRFWDDHGSNIMTVLGVVGVIATSVLTAKATAKVLPEIEGETKKEIIKKSWKHYIPAIVVGAFTCSCVVGSNVMNKSKQASLAGAVILLDQTYKKYKSKIDEVLGDGSDDKVVSSIIEETHKEYSPSDHEDEDRILFFDSYLCEYFESTLEAVEEGEQHIKDILMSKGSADLNDFYDFIGIMRDERRSLFGWEVEDPRDVAKLSFTYIPVIIADDDTGNYGEIVCYHLEMMQSALV